MFDEGNSYYVDFDKVPGVAVKASGSSEWYVSKLALEVVAPTSRSNDPATSKGKRRINKYEQAVLDVLDESEFGMTGKEIAERTGHPLNCITPRFAPLRRKNKIEPMEMRGKFVKRDKQIVWVLA